MIGVVFQQQEEEAVVEVVELQYVALVFLHCVVEEVYLQYEVEVLPLELHGILH